MVMMKYASSMWVLVGWAAMLCPGGPEAVHPRCGLRALASVPCHQVAAEHGWCFGRTR